jgi:tetratricopeptide (TPR) repeat protein
MIEEALQHLKSGNFAAAEALYRQMLADEPENPEVLYMLALSRQGQNDLEAPLELLGKAIRVQPKNPTLHHTLGMIQLQRRDLNDAERSFHTAVGIDPNFAAAQNGIAAVELARGRFAAAEQTLRKALRAEPDNPQVLLNMGVAMLEQDRATDAVSWLQRVIEQQPENHFALFHLGRAFLAQGNAGFAAGAFEKAAKLQPQSADIAVLLAEAQSRNQQHEEAARSYRRALDLGVETAQTLAGMARALAALGRHRESEGAYLRALRLSSGAGFEQVLLDFATGLLQQQRHDEVIQRLQGRFENDLQQAQDPARVTRLLARAKLDSGDAVAARDLLRPLLAGGAPDDEARLLLVRALRQAGEKDAAQAQLDRLLQGDEPPVDALLFAAGEQLSDGDLEGGIERLRGVQRRHDLSHEQRQRAVSMLANALHQAGEYQSAWEQYLGLDPQVADVMRLPQEKALQLEQDQPAETAMDRDVAWSWPPQPLDDGRPEPVFLLAWPGTGRSRLLQALDAHSEILTVQDRMATQQERRLLISHPRGREPLNHLTAAQIQLARRKYWKSLRRVAPHAGEQLTIDALWLQVEALPTIYRLFPQARVIVLSADPRDLALAWLQSSYRDPEGMARRYVQQASLLQRCQEGVPLKYIEVSAERLQASPANSLRDLVSALGLAWESAVEETFNQLPADLPQPGGWRNYAEWLQPVLGILETGAASPG